MSNLREHAQRELKIIGEDENVVKAHLDIIEIFRSLGHSGMSAHIMIEQLTKLLSFRPLSPLTNDPSEWNFISGKIYGLEEDLYQSVRMPEAFSSDAGKTYYIVTDTPRLLYSTLNLIEKAPKDNNE